jgi:hypothetical protein
MIWMVGTTHSIASTRYSKSCKINLPIQGSSHKDLLVGVLRQEGDARQSFLHNSNSAGQLEQ